jgi:Bacterial EndoU nuclease
MVLAMKFFNKNLLIINIVFLTYFNTYTITTESIVTAIENLISSVSTSMSSSTSTSTTIPTIEFTMEPYQYTIQTNDGLIHVEGFRNTEMGYDQQSATYEPYILNDYNKTDTASTSNLETPSTTNYEQDSNLQSLSNNIDIPDISNASNTPQKHDDLGNKLKEDAIESHRQETEYNHATQTQNTTVKRIKIIREKDLEKGKPYFHRDFGGIPLDSDLILQNPNINHDPRTILSSSIIKARFDRLSCFYKYQKNLGNNVECELNFLNALNSGKVVQLLDQIYNAHLSIAQAAFDELKKLWIRERKYMFLIPNSYNRKELDFLTKLGIDVMAIAERTLVTRPDYIAELSDEQSLKIIQEYQEHCILLQQQGNRSALSNEIKQFYRAITKKSDFATKISFVIAKKTFLNPVTTVLHEIANAPSLKKSCDHLKNLELQLLTQAQQRNIVTVNQMRTWTIEHYGFDVLDAAQNCYTSRPDYVYAPDNQSYLSDTIKPILHDIESKNLQGAHTELVHLEKQLTKGFKDKNITNSTAQKEYMVKHFGANVLETAHKTYENRADHQRLAESFMTIDVNQATIKILENNNSYESVANEMNDLAQHIFGNARLCNLSNLPKIESHVYNSIDAMRTAQDYPTFIFNFSMASRTLGDIQQLAHAILSGTHPTLERSSELLIKGFSTFFKGLNPLTQASNIGHLAYDLGSLLKKGCSALWNDPITAIDNGITTTFTLTELIIDTAYFTSDLTVGKLYLSPQEYQQRIDTFCEIMEPLQGVTGDQYAVFIGQFMADVVFLEGLGSAYKFLKEIDALSKLGESAATVARTFKKGFDTHLADNPIMISAEGVTIKLSEAMHNINNSGGGKNIINSSKSLLENAYAKISPELKPEIAAIKKTYDRTKDGFAEFAHAKVTMEYEHILGMELDLTKKGKLAIDGFHHDLKNAIEKNNILDFTNKIFNEHKCYKVKIFNNGDYVKTSTFFPAEWQRDKVVRKIYEAYEEFKNSGRTPKSIPNGTYKIKGFTKEGIEIEMVITRKGTIKTAYPKIGDLP